MNKFQELRIKNNLTQKELASKLGISQQALQKYESGKSKPSTNTLIKFAEYFGVSIEYISDINHIIYGQNKTICIRLSKEELDLIQNMRNMDPTSRRYIQEIIKLTQEQQEILKKNLEKQILDDML